MFFTSANLGARFVTPQYSMFWGVGKFPRQVSGGIYMMRKILWTLAFLVFVPCAKADTFVATSGFVSLSGDGGVITLSGVAPSGAAFTATGGMGP
jgi:hypothetical protein